MDAREKYILLLTGKQPIQNDGSLASLPPQAKLGGRSTLSRDAAKLEGFMRASNWNTQKVLKLLEELK